jgi:hypothetical protein
MNERNMATAAESKVAIAEAYYKAMSDKDGACVAGYLARMLNLSVVPQEAEYWTTKVDSTGRKLSGRHDYIPANPKAMKL